MWLCRNFTKTDCGPWFVAGEGLADRLDDENPLRPVNVATALKVNVRGALGRLRTADQGGWKIVAYAQGGYSCQRWIDGPGWCLLPDGDHMPEDVERMLCCALAIRCDLGDADAPFTVVGEWTVADILAREG